MASIEAVTCQSVRLGFRSPASRESRIPAPTPSLLNRRVNERQTTVRKAHYQARILSSQYGRTSNVQNRPTTQAIAARFYQRPSTAMPRAYTCRVPKQNAISEAAADPGRPELHQDREGPVIRRMDQPDVNMKAVCRLVFRDAAQVKSYIKTIRRKPDGHDALAATSYSTDQHSRPPCVEKAKSEGSNVERKENETLKQRADLMEDIRALRAEVSSLTKSNIGLQKDKEESDGLIDKFKKKLEQYRKEMSNMEWLKQDHDRRGEEIVRMDEVYRQKMKTLENELVQARQSEQNLAAQMQVDQRAMGEIKNELLRQARQSEKNEAQVQERLDAITQEKESLMLQVATLQTDLATERAHKARLEGGHADSLQQIETLQAQLSRADEELARIIDLPEKVEALERDLEHSRTVIERNTNEMRTLEAILAELQPEQPKSPRKGIPISGNLPSQGNLVESSGTEPPPSNRGGTRKKTPKKREGFLFKRTKSDPRRVCIVRRGSSKYLAIQRRTASEQGQSRRRSAGEREAPELIGWSRHRRVRSIQKRPQSGASAR
ncbi:hypothetical protein QBC46DRAFT_385693 [Diplogelasinospora grovesii]|uniref:Uncharacterized protein n=1 Tax=Diplogelasinospora grovesii TaxID=303347 RepID=A0AAN6N6S2_9PEZI|nr:hypothetical protein QBC46DRAFT_385693 [Diplogelasinospora grovesii]